LYGALAIFLAVFIGDTSKALDCSLSGESEYGLARSGMPFGGDLGSAEKRIKLRFGVERGEAGPLGGDRTLGPSLPNISVLNNVSYVALALLFSSFSLLGAGAAASRCIVVAARLNSTERSPALRLGTNRSFSSRMRRHLPKQRTSPYRIHWLRAAGPGHAQRTGKRTPRSRLGGNAAPLGRRRGKGRAMGTAVFLIHSRSFFFENKNEKTNKSRDKTFSHQCVEKHNKPFKNKEF
jgi:hypothetical protein